MRLEQNLLKSLFALQDLKYKEFHCRLMPVSYTHLTLPTIYSV